LVDTCRSADNARAAVARTAFDNARRLASLNVNGIASQPPVTSSPKQRKGHQLRPDGRSAGGPAGMAISSP